MSFRQMARFVAIIVLPLLITAPLQAQLPTGRIVGRVVDATTGQGVTDAGVQVVGTTLGVQTGVDGRFSLPRVNAGTVTIQVRRIGYVPKSVTGILLNAGQTLEQNITLAAAAARVEAQVVTASAERGSVSDALDRQRTAVGVVNSITAEQISRRARTAMRRRRSERVSGVTVQDDKTCRVRGLAERYTTSSLNGCAHAESGAGEDASSRSISFRPDLLAVRHDIEDVHAGSVGRLQRCAGQSQDAVLSG